MSENLDRLKTVRGSHRGVVTKLTKEKKKKKLAATEPLTTEQIDRLTVIRQQLNAKEQTLQTLNRDILNLCSLEEIETEANDAETVVAKIMDYKRRIDVALQPPFAAPRVSLFSPYFITLQNLDKKR